MMVENRRMRIGILTFGCRVNQYETQMMRERLAPRYDIVPGDADLYLVNACTVTSLAERKARQAMHRLRREQPKARILVVGCLADAVAQGLTQVVEADLLVGNAWKAWIKEAVARAFAGEQGVLPEKSPPSLDREAITSHSGHVRAFLKVQDGCDFSCTFCRTTQVRGPSCSKSVDAVLAEARLLVENGYRELVLTGINLAQYSPPDGDLASLARGLLRIEKLRRLRLASINPYGITAELVAAFAEDPRACPHFHIPLQSGDDTVLRRMQRGYISSFYCSRVEMIRRAIPQATFGADLIVGFPGEDEAAFARTCAMIEEVGFANLHIFRYSPREGTEAASFAAAVHEQDKKRRAGILDELGRSVRRRLFDGLVGSEQVVLVEEKKDGYFRGYTRGYIDVHISTEGTINIGDEVRVAITGATDTCLLGGEIRSN
jgi:threonylcarbamoyladenosine tRNA methylthiotransferase MtaB